MAERRTPAPAWLWFLSAGMGLAAGVLGLLVDNDFSAAAGFAWAVLGTVRGLLTVRKAGGAPQ
jgi:hypothetical protein